MYDDSYCLSDTHVEEPEVEYGLCVMPKTWVRKQNTWKDVDAKVYEKLGVRSDTSKRYTICFPKVAAKMKDDVFAEDEYGSIYREVQEQREIMGDTDDFDSDAYVTDGYASCMLKYCSGGCDVLLSGFCVLPQGENRGTSFMGHIKEYLFKRKEERLFLFTDSDCDPRIDVFYAKKCGFTLNYVNLKEYYDVWTKHEEGEEIPGFKELSSDVETKWELYPENKLYFVQLQEA